MHVLDADTPYVMRFGGRLPFAAGDLAFWTEQGKACPAPGQEYSVLNAGLEATVTLAAGHYELCLVHSDLRLKHSHISLVKMCMELCA